MPESECSETEFLLVHGGQQKRTVKDLSFLPDELLLGVFKYLPSKDLARMRKTSRRMKRVAQDKLLPGNRVNLHAPKNQKANDFIAAYQFRLPSSILYTNKLWGLLYEGARMHHDLDRDIGLIERYPLFDTQLARCCLSSCAVKKSIGIASSLALILDFLVMESFESMLYPAVVVAIVTCVLGALSFLCSHRLNDWNVVVYTENPTPRTREDRLQFHHRVMQLQGRPAPTEGELEAKITEIRAHLAELANPRPDVAAPAALEA